MTRATTATSLSIANHRALARWAADCAEHVLPHFERVAPTDQRPRVAVDVCRRWAEKGVFVMATIRGVALDAHAAARAVDDRTTAQFAARTAGQATATAHVASHALAAAWYAVKVADLVGDTDERARQWSALPVSLRPFALGVCAAKPSLARTLRYPA